MILGYHVILGFYGFWLPNDPRGSGSDFVGSWELFRFGPATKVMTTHSVAGVLHDRQARLAAKTELKYPPVMLSGDHPVYACSILPEHVHLVFGPIKYNVRTLISRFKQRATMRLTGEGILPPKLWARNGWTNYIDTEDELRRCIAYVENNPLKEGKPRQHWSFVTSPF